MQRLFWRLPAQVPARMVFYIATILLLTGVIFYTEEVKAASKTLSIPSKTQELDQWCWAASSQSVLAYYGISKTQCVIVAYAYPGCPNWSAHIYDVHATVLWAYNGISSDYLTRSLSWAEVQSTINNNRPAIIRWAWTSGGGHMVTIRGWDDNSGQRVSYMNPADGGMWTRDYSNLVSNSQWNWTHSVTQIRK